LLAEFVTVIVFHSPNITSGAPHGYKHVSTTIASHVGSDPLLLYEYIV
jgi:hypothetical protein